MHCGRCSSPCGRFEVCIEGACSQPCDATGLQGLLVIADATAVGSGDTAVMDLLERLGFGVTTLSSTEVASTESGGFDLVVISSTAQSNAVGTGFTDADVPVVCWDSHLYDDLGLTGPTAGVDYSAMLQQQVVQIVAPESPLAAGLVGAVRVFSQGSDMAWGSPAGDAQVIAAAVDNSNTALLFKFESGDELADGSPARARRMGIFLGDASPAVLTEDGERMVSTAFCWSVGRYP